jgi:hypothetical protein
MQTSQDWLKLAERKIEELTDRIYCRAAGPVNSSRVDWIEYTVSCPESTHESSDESKY